ncbi:hypothetical protein YPIP275_2848 [Yersinia pestis biovar Orientalis str. IP275]|uniref:Uncharacterized protein n=4 Tax=Enterobacterales TaxID=91347 RepID=G3F9M9_ECOLX|nr:hypothetical protein pNDM10505_106 [Escherichia coli]AFC34711.1 hypothetical protein pNDM10469_106 [Klebsiella pneumoniae]EDR32693.1 hypothetical protein YPIP275_2848 [Yersinia pestis biovar Orientalis str. IP275]QHJ90562.1 hypothetical protein [Klebsiella aerogenes]AEP32564.1 hypothetical protein pNDM102337_106 [Escherichia coli]
MSGGFSPAFPWGFWESPTESKILFSSESEKCDSWSPKTNSKLTLIY